LRTGADMADPGERLAVRTVGRGLRRWVIENGRRQPIAVVMGASVNGLSFVRSLGRRGVPTLLLDSDRLIGTYTRYGKLALLPPPDERADAWIELLTSVGSLLGVPGVLFFTSDTHAVLVAEAQDVLRRYFRFLIPSAQTMERIVNKRIQYSVAQATGIPIPKSYFPESVEEVIGIASEVIYPCILKPYKAHLGRSKIVGKVALVQTPEQLVAEYRRLDATEVHFLVQEVVPGGDDTLYGYMAFWDADGCEHSWVTKRKLRQNSRFGDGSLQVTVEAPEVTDQSRRLLRAFGYTGFVGVEFKFDARDRTFRLMEINPRTVSGNQLPITAGVDFPWIGYRYLSSWSRPVPRDFARGVKYLNEEWDLKGFFRLRKAGQLTTWEWLRSLRGVKALAIWAWDDPLPMVVVLWRLLLAGIRRLRWVAEPSRGGATPMGATSSCPGVLI